MNKISINTYLSIITLNINGLNAPIERHRVAEWIPKKNLIYIHPIPSKSNRIQRCALKGFALDNGCVCAF